MRMLLVRYPEILEDISVVNNINKKEAKYVLEQTINNGDEIFVTVNIIDYIRTDNNFRKNNTLIFPSLDSDVKYIYNKIDILAKQKDNLIIKTTLFVLDDNEVKFKSLELPNKKNNQYLSDVISGLSGILNTNVIEALNIAINTIIVEGIKSKSKVMNI